jgi:hypothetical protein
VQREREKKRVGGRKTGRHVRIKERTGEEEDRRRKSKAE